MTARQRMFFLCNCKVTTCLDSYTLHTTGFTRDLRQVPSLMQWHTIFAACVLTSRFCGRHGLATRLLTIHSWITLLVLAHRQRHHLRRHPMLLLLSLQKNQQTSRMKADTCKLICFEHVDMAHYSLVFLGIGRHRESCWC